MSEGAKREGEERPVKEARRQFRAIKGTRDILPPDSSLWNWFEKTARSVMESYNFAEIRTPIFEETELFARAVGVETDVVMKEMYTFEDHDHAELARLRSTLLLWEVEGASLKEASDFISQMWIFVTNFQVAYETAKVPRTPENKQSFDSLYNEALEMGAALTRLETLDAGKGRAKEMFLNKQMVEYDFGQIQFERRVSVMRQFLQAIAFGDDITLRPEATASVCRAYIEHRLDTRPGDQKLYYIGPMFRRERPQKGRYRQFYQIGAEVLGTSDAPAIDAELIQMLTDLLERCQIEKYTLLINSIGCQNCRPTYVERLRKKLREPEIFSKLGVDSQRRVETNPLRVMDSKLPEEQAIIEKLPKISEHLCTDCREHYEKLKLELKLREVPFTEAPRLVRGLDYYMRTTFEITSPILGAQNALCGGGRYDGLVEMLGGPKGIKGIGFALGEDRFIDAIQEAKKIDAVRAVDVFIAWMGEKAYPEAVRLARLLRDAGRAVELPPVEMKFRKALERADKMGARYVLIIGDDEIASDMLTIKRLADGKQEKVAEGAVLKYIEG